MSKLNLSDLKEQGLTLTKAEAHELLSAVSQHSQHTPDNGVMYEGVTKAEESPVKKETKVKKVASEKQETEEAKANEETEEVAPAEGIEPEAEDIKE